MKLPLSPVPDLSANRRLILTALFVGLVACITLAWKANLNGLLGDTDDATRLVIVRDLLAGRGWYDVRIDRLYPPQGVYLHWSRLLDGAIAAPMWLLGRVMPGWMAEYWTRFFWPMAWIFPTVAGALAIGRSLGARSAVFITAIPLLITMQLYRQFLPGRIDHHNIQICMTVIALACALARRNRIVAAAIGGVATALGLAIGLEAIAFHALIGASYGAALMADRAQARRAGAYGLALAGASVAFFALQTPPWRWGLSFCDALAANLVAALVVAGLGLALAAYLTGRLPAWGRAAVVLAAGALAAGVYLALDPICIHGPFAQMDPRVKPFWFNRIQEVQPWPRMFKLERVPAISALTMTVLSLLAGGYLIVRGWRDQAIEVALVGLCLAAAAVTAWFGWRMQDYVFWMGAPAFGAALSWIAARRLNDLMLPAALMALVLSPATVAIGGAAAANLAASGSILKSAPGKPKESPGHHSRVVRAACFRWRAYGPLARLPKGLVLADEDFGPFILAFTHHSAVSAPYHRMSAAILAGHLALDAPAGQAQARVRALGANYIIDCRPYPMVLTPGGLTRRLRAGQTPAWLESLSPSDATLRIWRVR